MYVSAVACPEGKTFHMCRNISAWGECSIIMHPHWIMQLLVHKRTGSFVMVHNFNVEFVHKQTLDHEEG